MRASKARLSGGEDEESCGTRAVTAAHRLVVDRPRDLDQDHDVVDPPRHIGVRTLS